MPKIKDRFPARKGSKADKTGRSVSPDFSNRIKKALSRGLKIAGIHSKVEIEPIRMTKLYRISVLARKFENMRPSERQNLVWRIVGQNFNPDEQLQISMILTLAPTELKGNL